MVSEEIEGILVKHIEAAYKKLKSYSYYDNRNIFLKNRIVDFENDNIKEESSEKYIESISEKFNLIKEVIDEKKRISFNFIHSSLLEKNNMKFSEINFTNLDVIVNFTIRSVPKSIIDDQVGSTIIKNFEGENSKATVDKVMYYLDLDIMSQIIGTLWVTIIGKELEKEYIDYTAGNILDDNISDNLKLFKPYYLSYERWRDDAINIVEDRIDKGNRSTMLSLDIKEYYYSINLDIEKTKKEIEQIFNKSKSEKYVSEEIFKRINDYVFEVIKAYSNAMHLYGFSDNQNTEEKYILPIGFLPSSILSNWYLRDFDNAVNRRLTPLYYKRYVDDILIIMNTDYNKQEVFNEEEILNGSFYDTELFEIGVLVNNKNNSEGKSTEILVLNNAKEFLKFTSKIDRIDTRLKKNILDMIESILNENTNLGEINNIFTEEDIFIDWSNKNPIEEKCELSKLENKIKDINRKLKIDSNKFKKIYLIKYYIESKKAYLIIQDEKVKVYDFVSDGSKSLIENFKREIKENSSAFRFLPQKDEVLNSFDKEVYKVDYKDSIHKLSSIESLKINRYNLSKFLARIIYSDKLENDHYINDVDEKILWIFKGGHAVEYFFLWDKVFNYYLMNRRYDKIKKLYGNINSSINNLTLDLANFSFININYKDINSAIRVNNLKTDLKLYLKFVLAMNYALDDSIFINEIKKNNDFKRKIIQDNSELIINVQEINTQKEYIRISNMLNHSFVKSPLMNYYYLNYKKKYSNEENLINFNFINSIVGKPEVLSNRNSCFFVNSNYEKCFIRQAFINQKENVNQNYDIQMCKFAVKYNPRFVHLHECIINSIENIIASGEIVCKGNEIIDAKKTFYDLNGIELNNDKIGVFPNINNVSNYVTKSDNINYVRKNNILNTHFKYFDLNDYLFLQKERVINYLEYGNTQKKDKLKVGIVNMKIYDEDLVKSFKKRPNIGSKRLENISKMLNIAKKNGADIIVFPEVSIPVEWLGVVSDFSRRNDILIICGLEHVIYDNKLCCNYIATILPDKYRDYSFAVVKLRLKNHYSPNEKEWVKGYGWNLPTENNAINEYWQKEYDLFRWKGIDFSTFSCFELANIQDRALFTSYVDVLVGSVHNRDVNYYSNVIESLARDVHCYFVHVNDSNLGDSRVIKPASTNNKNILQVSGGMNDTVLIGEVDIKNLRDFQIKDHNLQMKDNRFKAVPPEYKHNNVKIRDDLPL